MSAGPAICPKCFTALIWIDHQPKPIFWCAGCRCDVDPEKALIK